MATNNMGPYSAASSTSTMAAGVFLGRAVFSGAVIPTAANPSLPVSVPELAQNPNGAVDTPPATGGITVPNSPTGASTAATGFTTSWNYVHGENSTEAFLFSAYTEANWDGVRVPVNRP